MRYIYSSMIYAWYEVIRCVMYMYVCFYICMHNISILINYYVLLHSVMISLGSHGGWRRPWSAWGEGFGARAVWGQGAHWSAAVSKNGPTLWGCSGLVQTSRPKSKELTFGWVFTREFSEVWSTRYFFKRSLCELPRGGALSLALSSTSKVAKL